MSGSGRDRIRMYAMAGLLLLVGSRHASADSAVAPIRIAIECETSGRTKACPAFLLGFVEATELLLSAPRASADVMLYASAAEVAQIDRVHLRFVGTVPGAPPVVVLDVDVDSRADDDTQRAQLEPAFLRGVSLFVAARYPQAVTVALGELDGVALAPKNTSPWGASLGFTGSGSYTTQYKSYIGSSELEVTRLTRQWRIATWLFADTGLVRQPPLELADGTIVDLDHENWAVEMGAAGAWLLDRHWSVGAVSRLGRDDPKGQFERYWSARAGIEWDRYQADDPRGNRLALVYFVGYQVDRYNLRNELGERFARYPIHGMIVSGSVRKDRISTGIALAVDGMLLRPTVRHNVSASPFVEWKLGAHVDIGLTFSVTKRALPGPHADEIDPGDFAQQSRLSYAEPFAMNGSLSLKLHLDRTNGARNDRLSEL